MGGGGEPGGRLIDKGRLADLARAGDDLQDAARFTQAFDQLVDLREYRVESPNDELLNTKSNPTQCVE